MLCTVRPDMEFLCRTKGIVAADGIVYECWVNQNGAVSAIVRGGERLGVKPDEFEVVDWHEVETTKPEGNSP